jgi:FlaA1/EpsC-like NDP-sugar epimerase
MAQGKKSAGLFILDQIIIWFSIAVSYLIRFNGNIPDTYYPQMAVYGLFSSFFIGISMVRFGMYRRIWQYAGRKELVAGCKAVFIGATLAYIATSIVDPLHVPVSVGAFNAENLLLLLGGVRLADRIFTKRTSHSGGEKINTLIFGAGACGAVIAKEILQSTDRKLVGFLDDDPGKLHYRVLDVPILGNRCDLVRVTKELGVREIIIAIPSAPRKTISEIINLCIPTGAKVKKIPNLGDLISGKVSIGTVRDVDVEDLLGREPVVTDLEEISGYLQDKIVLITGAGGTIGSELSRQIASFRPAKLLLVGHGENSIFSIAEELRYKYPGLNFEPIIADIQHRSRMEEVFRVNRPQVVFHAAAHKHVTLMENNPAEAVKNNVFGTKNVVDCAEKYEAERFVLISTDKAVNPTSIMGMTKRLAEMYIQSMDGHSKTRFAAVRFGNVLGSRGSVVPLFKEQIARGGPVTVTHPDMVRYFMTIPEAVQLVIQAGAYMNGGEIFVLDMGKPVRILQLAEDLIRLSGFEPYVDIPIEFIGARPGEKLFEELLFHEEEVTATKHERIFIGKLNGISKQEVEIRFRTLENLIFVEKKSVQGILEDLVDASIKYQKSYDVANQS